MVEAQRHQFVHGSRKRRLIESNLDPRFYGLRRLDHQGVDGQHIGGALRGFSVDVPI